MTTRAGVIGNPVKHSLSPIMHNAAYKFLNLDWHYEAMELDLDSASVNIDEIFKNGCGGLNVTMPFKELAYRKTTAHGPALRLHSVNTIIPDKSGNLHGYSTDGEGFINSLTEIGFDVKGKRSLVIGAGGASKAICDALVNKGAHVLIAARKMDQSLELIKAIMSNSSSMSGTIDVVDFSERQNVCKDCGLIVNATPIGMTIDSKPDKTMPIEVKDIDSSALVVDTIYYPLETEFLKQSKQKGCKTLNGLGMLIHQGALAFNLMTHEDAPIEQMKNAIEEHLQKVKE